ncbi:MAG TPA: NRDE family protein [Steroidobacteraceae bacterium]|nr:NRDE family protein [Steroidobacteraceae bacterium]
MCLLAFAWKSHPRYHLVLAGNRDEFHDRAATPLGWWPDDPRILAGRDERAGGTWLGVARSGRIGVITNFRDLEQPVTDAPSRGGLIPRFLTGATSPKEFLDDLRATSTRYAGFSLLTGGPRALYYLSNRGMPEPRALAPGIYALSNHLLDTPWHKVERVRERLRQALVQDTVDAESLFAALDDREPAPVNELPATGLSPEWERLVSAPFIVHPRYGTRCSTVLIVERSGRTVVIERRFDPTGTETGRTRQEFRSADVPEVWYTAEDPDEAAPRDASFDTSPE